MMYAFLFFSFRELWTKNAFFFESTNEPMIEEPARD